MSVRILWIGLVLLGLAACAGSPVDNTTAPDTVARDWAELRGSAFYRERMLLPPGAELVVVLRDAAMPDAATIAEYRAPVEGGGPFDFALRYDATAIEATAGLALTASLLLGERVLFRSEPVTTRQGAGEAGANPILMLSTVTSAFDEPAPANTDGLTGRRWIAEDIGGAGVMDMLQSSLEFSAAGRVSGSTGCNQLNGSYQAQDGLLRFGPLATTRRGCVGAIMEQEQRFLSVLEQVERYRLDERGALLLMAANGATLMRMMAEE